MVPFVKMELNNSKKPPSAPNPEPGVGINVIINNKKDCTVIIWKKLVPEFPKAL